MEEAQPDLVVVCMTTPGLDGRTLLRGVKAEWPNLPVIILPGANEHGDRAGALAVDANGVISEAMSPAEIRDHVAPSVCGGC
jgi:DNA-binding NarL/FixJ family response regulator